MQLGLSENLSSLVSRRFVAARDAGHLIFSPTHLATVHASGIPYQLRYCPALAKKPSGAPNQSQARPGPKPDPFQDPSADLLIAPIPRDNLSHILVLNKFPVIQNHFILATKPWKPQTDLLEKDDLEAAYACVRAWQEDGESNDAGTEAGARKRLFAFFNSGEESGASQPHRHLQFLPVEAMALQAAENASASAGASEREWQLLVDAVAAQPPSPGSSQFRRLSQLPFAHFALPLPANPSADVLHGVYLALYRAALATSRGSRLGREDQEQTSGPASVSYNLAMTDSVMMICPRRSESARIDVDAAASRDVAEAGVVALNGTLLAGTLMVKAEAEWDELRRNPESLAEMLAAIGYSHPDLRELALL